ncbi:PepSY domain-containing protein [Chryseomicrobium sp. FSL W7-1435]|uniref:PepSY domain-containing protein n=1 Tax=Chryseomicrobium sp. FSL W7-1435 TaxID=2921704 RepID=UPI00315AF2E2
MRLRDYMMGLGTGVVIGVVASQAATRYIPSVTADQVLEQVKDAFKQEGPIDGSWVYMKTEPFHIGFIETTVYKGGITRMKNGVTENYEFAADARTGSVLEIKHIS